MFSTSTNNLLQTKYNEEAVNIQEHVRKIQWYSELKTYSQAGIIKPKKGRIPRREAEKMISLIIVVLRAHL